MSIANNYKLTIRARDNRKRLLLQMTTSSDKPITDELRRIGRIVSHQVKEGNVGKVQIEIEVFDDHNQ